LEFEKKIDHFNSKIKEEKDEIRNLSDQFIDKCVCLKCDDFCTDIEIKRKLVDHETVSLDSRYKQVIKIEKKIVFDIIC